MKARYSSNIRFKSVLKSAEAFSRMSAIFRKCCCEEPYFLHLSQVSQFIVTSLSNRRAGQTNENAGSRHSFILLDRGEVCFYLIDTQIHP